MPLVRRALAGLLGTLVSLVGLVGVSSAVGGPLTWAVTQGASMVPTYPPGTLVVLQRQALYAVGDVVAYRNAELQTTVLHRVTAVQDARLTLQGDANSWSDPYRPTVDEAVGRPLLAVPGLGRAVVVARPVLALLVLLGLLAVVLLPRLRRRAGSGRRSSARGQAPSGRPDSDAARSWQGQSSQPRQAAAAAAVVLPQAVTAAASTALLTVVGLGVLTVVLPTGASARSVQTDDGVDVRFGYDAAVPAGIVYPTGRVTTGDPVFLKVVDRLAVTAGLHLPRPGGTSVSGRWRLEVDVSDDSGWRSTVYRSADASPDDRELQVVLTPSRLLRLADTAAVATGAPAGGRRVTVRAVVDAAVGTRAVPRQTTASYALALDAVALRPVTEQPARTGSPVTLPSGSSAPAQRTLLGLPVALLQQALVLAGVACIVVLVLAARSRRDADARDVLHAEHADLMLATAPVAVRGPVVDVVGPHELFLVAQRYDRLVLHWTDAGSTTYLVQDEGTAYRWTDVRAVVPVPRRAPDQRSEAHRA